jgi:hypothetical protein
MHGQDKPTPARSQVERKRTFTSEKLDIMNALNVDPRIKRSTFKVSVAILKHINERTGTANPSDETLSDETNLSIRTVIRAREALREYGWLIWRRTRSSNVYKFKTTNINNSLDLLALRRDDRADRRRNRHMTAAAYLKPLAVPPLAVLDVPPAADKHVTVTPTESRGKKASISIAPSLARAPNEPR